MTAPTYRYSLYPATFGTGSDEDDDETSFTLTQIRSVGVRPNAQKDVLIPGGAIDPQAIMLNAADPSVVISSDDLEGVLSNVSLVSGCPCVDGALIRWQPRDDLDSGTFLTAQGLVFTSTIGYLFPTMISAVQDQPAVCELEYRALYDGTNEPLTIADNQSLSGVNPLFNSLYYLGPAYLNGSPLAGLVRVEVNPGIFFDSAGCRQNGDVYSRLGAIVTRRPSVSLTFKKLNMVVTASDLFSAAVYTGGGLNIYFQCGVSGGPARVSPTVADHIKIMCSAGAWNTEDVSATENGDGTLTLTFQLRGELAITVGSTIP